MGKYTLETYTQEKYEQDYNLVNAVENVFSIDFRNPEKYTEDKKKILKNVLGYRALRVGSNKNEITFLPLDECNFGRINNTLKERYLSASNRITKFGDPSKRFKKEKGLVKKIEQIKQLSLFR